MEINKRFTLGLIMYLPAAAIAIELTAKLRGYTPIQSDTQTSNNIFYGILGNCSATALKNKSSSIEPAILDSLHCIKSPIKYVLNTKPNYKTSHNSQEFKTEPIRDD